MKFIISSTVLKQKLSPIFSCLNSSTVLPILEDIFFEADKDAKTLICAGTDLENYFEVTIKDVHVGESGRICIDSRQLKGALKCEEQPITFVVDKSLAVTVIGDNFKIKLTGENSDNYPKRPTVNVRRHAIYDTKDFIPIIRQASIFCSNDYLRPSMTGVYVHEIKKELWIVATDAHKLFYKKLHIPETFQSYNELPENKFGTHFILPKKSASLLSSLEKKGEQVYIKWDVTHTTFEIADYTLISRCIDARFPDYQVVLQEHKKSATNSIKLVRKEATAFIKIAKEFSNKSTNQMQLRIDPKSERIEVISQDIDFSMEFYCTLRAYDTKMKQPLTIAFNAEFLIQILRQTKDEYVYMQLPDVSTKAMIVDEQILIMPLMLNQ